MTNDQVNELRNKLGIKVVYFHNLISIKVLLKMKR